MEHKRELIEDYISWFFEYARDQNNELEIILNLLNKEQIKELHEGTSINKLYK